MTMRHFAMWLIAFGLAAATSGCVGPNEMFGGFSPPDGSRLVGGGEAIEFEAPEDGTVYLTRHGRLELSKSVTKGEKLHWLGEAVMIGPGSARRRQSLCSHARLHFEPLKTPGDDSEDH